MVSGSLVLRRCLRDYSLRAIAALQPGLPRLPEADWHLQQHNGGQGDLGATCSDCLSHFRQYAGAATSVSSTATSSPQEKNVGGTPASQAVAVMSCHEQMPYSQVREAMKGITDTLRNNFASYSVAEVATVAEVCRRVEYQPANLFQTIHEDGVRLLNGAHYEEVAPIMWAVAQVSPPHPAPLLHAVSQAVTSHVKEMEPGDFPLIVRCCADLRLEDPFTLMALQEEVLLRMGDFSAGELKELVEAFGALGRWYYDRHLFDALGDAVAQRLGEYSKREVAQLLDVYRGLAHKHLVLFKSGQDLLQANSTQGL